MQDDSYSESYISTIGVDFVSELLNNLSYIVIFCVINNSNQKFTVLFPFLFQKIRTVEQDGKTIKLQIV